MARMRRFRRKPKRRYAWTGVLYEDQTVTETGVAFELFGPTAGEISVNTDLLLHRVILGWSTLNGTVLDATRVSVYLAVLDTSNTLLPFPYTADPDDVDYYQKRDTMYMDVGYLEGTGTDGDAIGTFDPPFGHCVNYKNNGMPLDITVKRKIRGDQGLYFVVGVDGVGEGTFESQFTVWARALVSGGRV